MTEDRTQKTAAEITKIAGRTQLCQQPATRDSMSSALVHAHKDLHLLSAKHEVHRQHRVECGKIEGLGASGSPPMVLGLGDGLQGLAVLVDEERHVSQHSARLHRIGQGRSHVVSVLQDKLVGDAVGRLEGGLVSGQDGDCEGHSLRRAAHWASDFKDRTASWIWS